MGFKFMNVLCGVSLLALLSCGGNQKRTQSVEDKQALENTSEENIKKVELTKSLVTRNASIQAQNVFRFLQENYGKKMISGVHANVNWNSNEAEWVKFHTGKYPVMNTLDYIHLRGEWLDYTNVSGLEDWWNNKGLICADWHWMVPRYEKDTDLNKFTYKPDETTFKASNVLVIGTWENKFAMADLEKLADCLLALQKKNIPVIWRPLHEASGNIYKQAGGTAWFWWGNDGADTYKKLWIYMFDYFQKRGVNNLIWVWTSQIGDNAFYPGDKYVDIIGRDAYGMNDPADLAMEYEKLQESYPNKMIALSEFGKLPSITTQWDEGAKWSFFMSWYDYNRTNKMSEEDFTSTHHGHANAQWWKDAVSNDAVIMRDDMPNLK